MGEETLEYKALLATATSGLGCMLPFDIPGFHFRKAMNARRELGVRYQKIIDEKRSNPSKVPESMLDYVLVGGSHDGSEPSDIELQDFCFAMAFAGHDTTLSTMQTMLHYLDANPSVTEQLRQEVSSVWDGQAPVTRSVLQRLHKCRAFTVECMRLTPPVQNVSRTIGSDAVLDGYTIKTGTTIYLGMKSVTDETMKDGQDHVNLENHLDADGSFVDRTHDFARFAAFGCGGRMCIGYKFAMDEMSVFLLSLLHSFDFCVESRKRVPFPFNFWRVKVSFSKRNTLA